MTSETRQCQSCKETFPVEDRDVVFYEKVKVPTPNFCPSCRNQRRMSWRNERSLYKRKCDAPEHSEDIISMYSSESGIKAYDAKFWWSDGWDPLEYGREYDFSKPFFRQYGELFRAMPQLTLSTLNSVASEYTNFVDGNKNCYLIFGSGWSENSRYGNKMMNCRDSQDLLMCTKCELCYECVNCLECYRLFFSNNCKNCSNSYFLYGCRNCQDCFGCANLVNKQYCFFNEQLTKEEYLKRLEELGIDHYGSILKVREDFREKVYLKAIHRYANIVGSQDCTGDNINNSKDCRSCFDVFQDLENCSYQYSSLELKDAYDGNGIYQNDLGYELVDCNVGQRNLGSVTIYACNDCTYSFNCHSSSNLFGCVGLKNKQYCILNKQYTKEEYEKLKEKIKKHMDQMPYVDKAGNIHRYADFFPTETSPWAYNETIAQEYYPVSPEKGQSKGYSWKEQEERGYTVTKNSNMLPETITDADERILKEIIGCEHAGKCNEQCTYAFRIIPEELDFYRRLHLPLPRFCPNCRHYARLAQRNPLKLWERSCQCLGSESDKGTYKNNAEHEHGTDHCPNLFQTSYSPEHPEIVYCDSCYQKEVL